MRRLIAAAALLGCASIQAPPGGPEDPDPPVLVSRAPDSGAVAVRPRSVVLTFDEVVQERAAGRELSDIVLISPRTGRPRVSWHRRSIEIRPGTDWKENTTYTVTVRPGLSDLRNNRSPRTITTVFSTGNAIANARIAGVVFDWITPKAAPDALVEAISLPDSTVYVTASDSTGRFILAHIPSGRYIVRGLLDTDRDNEIDSQEMWGSDTVTVTDSQHVELLAFVHDSLPPRITSVMVRDTFTVVATLDRPLAEGHEISNRFFSVLRADSTPVPLQQVRTLRAFEAAADSARMRDTTVRPVPQILGVPGARPEAQLALMPSRESPVRSIVIVTAVPLEPGERYRVRAENIRGLLGAQGNTEAPFTTPPRGTPAPERK